MDFAVFKAWRDRSVREAATVNERFKKLGLPGIDNYWTRHTEEKLWQQITGN